MLHEIKFLEQHLTLRRDGPTPHPVDPREELYILTHRQILVERKFLHHVAYPALYTLVLR